MMFAILSRRGSNCATAIVLAALFLAPLGVLAASPEDDYIAARDRYVAELKKLEAPEDLAAHEALKAKDTADLEGRLKAMLGPFALAGFPSEGRLNPDLYDRHRPLGNLDGLAYHGPDKEYEGDAGAALVTTEGLLDKWLQRPTRDFPEGDTRTRIALPRSAAAAVATEGFYILALEQEGPAVARFANIPVRTPPGAKFATAMLVTTDVGPEIPRTPDRVFIALDMRGRIFIVSVRPETPFKAIPACTAVLGAYDAKAEAAEKAFNSAGDMSPKAQAKLEKLTVKLSDDGQAAFLSCFADKTRNTPEFTAATKQAAVLIEGLARN